MPREKRVESGNSPGFNERSLMIDAAIHLLQEHFRSLKDPRAQHSIDHLLLDMVLITICAVICGADTWGEIENLRHRQTGMAEIPLLANYEETCAFALRSFAQ